MLVYFTIHLNFLKTATKKPAFLMVIQFSHRNQSTESIKSSKHFSLSINYQPHEWQIIYNKIIWRNFFLAQAWKLSQLAYSRFLVAFPSRDRQRKLLIKCSFKQIFSLLPFLLCRWKSNQHFGGEGQWRLMTESLYFSVQNSWLNTVMRSTCFAQPCL